MLPDPSNSIDHHRWNGGASAANSTGGVMIDAQSIVVSSSTTHQQGNEAAIFKAVFWHSIVWATLVGLIVMVCAFIIPSAIP